MHRQISLIVIFSILLIGVSFVGNGFAERAHSFDSDFGKYGITKSGSFLSPQHLAFDSEDNLYVTDLGNARVQKFDSNGNFLLEWGSIGTESGKFGHPSGIVIYDKFVFVVDNRNHNVQKFDLDGNFISKWGSYGSDNGFFKSPRGVTISDNEFIFVVDSGNARIQIFDLDGNYVSQFGQSGQRGGNFITPVDIAINSNKIFVTDSTLNGINIYDLDGKFLRTINDSVGGFSINPNGIIFDEQNNFYISDYRNNRIIQYNEFGISLSVFGQMGINDAQFKFPKDVAISKDGYLFVTDTQGHRIQKFSTPVSTEYSLKINDESIVNPEIKSDLEVVSLIEYEKPPKILTPNDFKKPTIIVPDDVLIEASGLLTTVNIGNAMATDENGILSLSHNAPSSFPLGTNTIIWTAIDGVGNMAIASQIVAIQDTTPPLISSLDDISLEAKSTTENLVELIVPEISDDVGVYSITNDAPEVFPLGETLVTWTATDIIGNTSTFSQSVFLIDSISPRIAFTDDLIIEASNLSENLVELIIPESFDDVGVYSITNDAPEVFQLGETLVTWTATDASGNSAATFQIISVIDTAVPVIEISNYEIEANIPNGSDTSLSLPIISDIQNVELTNDAPEVFPLGETLVTWTATDTSSNSASTTQIISVIDTTLPTVMAPNDIQVEATSIDTNIVEFGSAEASDLVEIASITNDAPEVFPLGETLVTWTATDTSSNSASTTQIISVIDTTLPTVMAPNDIQVEASDSVENTIDLGAAEASDLVEIASITNDAPEVFPLGETLVTWTATDTSSNSASTTQIISVIDTTLPTVMAPNDIQVEATSIDTNIVEFGSAEASDLVEIASITNDAPEVFPLGETLVTWTATDTSSNSASTTQIISVIDTTLPTVMAPNDIQVEASDSVENTIDLGAAEASDLVEIASITNDAPEVFPLGETLVTWTATDTSSNSASTTQIISVIDTTLPTVMAPNDIQVEATSIDTNIVEFGSAEASDLVEIASITNDAPEVFPLGETLVTWTATDTSSNSASTTQIISVIDTTAPEITIFESFSFEAINQTGNIFELPMIESVDNTEIVSITNDAPISFEFGITIVTWTVVDISGNISTSEQEVHVIDTTLPTVMAPNDIQVEATSIDTNIVEFGSAEASDLVEIASITNDAPEVFPLGETLVTWTATDTSSNSASTTQIISVIDTTAPEIEQPLDVIMDASSKSNNTVNLDKINVIESISDVVITTNAPLYYEFGETLVTWTATDTSGNSASTTQIINVIDISAPSLDTPQNIIIDAVNTTNFIEIGFATVDDIIDDSPTITNDAPEVFPLGETLVTWTATDKFENSSSSIQIISVQACGNSPSYYNTIIGSEEDDLLTGTSLSDLIFGKGGDDIISGSKGNDCILGGEGNDIIFGNAGDDNISGQDGNDIIKGNSGEDFVFGGLGLDIIDGGDDIDTCKIIDEQNNDIIIKCESNLSEN